MWAFPSTPLHHHPLNHPTLARTSLILLAHKCLREKSKEPIGVISSQHKFATGFEGEGDGVSPCNKLFQVSISRSMMEEQKL